MSEKSTSTAERQQGSHPSLIFTYLNTTVGMVVMIILGVAAIAYHPLVIGSSDRLQNIEHLLRGEFVQRYPDSGVIATFARSMRPIATGQEEQLSLFSDSSHRGTSTIYYSDASDAPSQGGGNQYLRIHYHLTPSCESPFAGVFANLSNPMRVFDISHFQGVEISCRWGKEDDGEQSASFLLCDRNASEDQQYAWAEQVIPLKTGQGGHFQTLRLPISKFRTPTWRGLGEAGIPFDTTRVFRFTIKIGTTTKKDCQGVLEINEIRFYGMNGQ